MRLTTLARKINITPKQLISFLNEKDIEIEKGLHGKLEKNIVEMVLEHFSADIVLDINEQDDTAEKALTLDTTSLKEVSQPANDEVAENLPDDSDEQEDQKAEVIDHQEVESVPANEESAPQVGTVEDLESEDFEHIELIKVRKVKLEGIKVVGKIELPMKPSKDVSEVEQKDVNNEQSPEQKSEKPAEYRKNFDRKRKKNKQGRSREPLSYDEKLKEEEREKLRKRRRRENAEKRRKIKYYEQHIQPKVNQKSKKKKAKKQEPEKQSQSKEIVMSKNPIRRFWAWLNGEYDKY